MNMQGLTLIAPVQDNHGTKLTYLAVTDFINPPASFFLLETLVRKINHRRFLDRSSTTMIETLQNKSAHNNITNYFLTR